MGKVVEATHTDVTIILKIIIFKKKNNNNNNINNNRRKLIEGPGIWVMGRDRDTRKGIIREEKVFH